MFCVCCVFGVCVCVQHPIWGALVLSSQAPEFHPVFCKESSTVETHSSKAGIRGPEESALENLDFNETLSFTFVHHRRTRSSPSVQQEGFSRAIQRRSGIPEEEGEAHQEPSALCRLWGVCWHAITLFRARIFVTSKCAKSGQSSVSVLTVRSTVVRWHPGLAGDCRLERVASFLSNSALRDVTKVPQERQHGGTTLN